MGADWMTRSSANLEALGGTIDKPGGGLRLEPLEGPNGLISLKPSFLCSLDSMMDLC